jgi:hypothetical protein
VRNLTITLALAALIVAKGQSQTSSAPEAPVETPVAYAPASPTASPNGTSNRVATLGAPNTDAPGNNPELYTWPSPTVTNPYPTLSLPRRCAPPACAANEDTNGDLLKGDPLLDWSPWASGPGWFGALEVDAVGPSVKNRLNAPVTIGGAVTTVLLPSADLNWTAIPHVELGYRLEQGAGELLVSYRSLNAAGSGNIAAFDAAGNSAPLTSHLNMSVIDFDYASRENSLGPLWDMKWRTGIRVATIFFDSSATTALLSQHESNNFTGGGLHFGLHLKRRLGESGFSLVGQLDGGAVLGSVHQLYSETVAGAGSGQALASQVEPAPVLEVRFGVDYAPPQLSSLRLSTGYLFERWWTVGETHGTQGEVTYQGLFFRGEWRY